MADISLGSSASVVAARPELSIHDGIVTTTSLQVAQFFGKRHDSVVRSIRGLSPEMVPDDYRHNFVEVIVDYTNGKGGAQIGKAYRMTREGFMHAGHGLYRQGGAALKAGLYRSLQPHRGRAAKARARPAAHSARTASGHPGSVRRSDGR